MLDSTRPRRHLSFLIRLKDLERTNRPQNKKGRGCLRRHRRGRRGRHRRRGRRGRRLEGVLSFPKRHASDHKETKSEDDRQRKTTTTKKKKKKKKKDKDPAGRERARRCCSRCRRGRRERLGGAVRRRRTKRQTGVAGGSSDGKRPRVKVVGYSPWTIEWSGSSRTRGNRDEAMNNWSR